MYQTQVSTGKFTVYEQSDFPIGSTVKVVDIGAKPNHPRYLQGNVGIVVPGTSKNNVKVQFKTFDCDCWNIHPQFLRLFQSL